MLKIPCGPHIVDIPEEWINFKRGDFCVNRPIYCEYEDAQAEHKVIVPRQINKEWNVTHIHSGFKIFTFSNVNKARGLVKALEGYDLKVKTYEECKPYLTELITKVREYCATVV